jgi:GTP cyclohydrolase IA
MINKNLCDLLGKAETTKKRVKSLFPSPLLSKESKLSNEKKLKQIEYHFTEILKILGLDLSNDSIKDTPKRIAKMYVKEIFSSLDEKSFPALRFFDDIPSEDKRMILTKDIPLNSICEHHFLPMIGKAHVAYIPNKKIIGLSKINRLVNYFSKRPQLQERLTSEIANCLSNILDTEDVAVYTSLKHLCITTRGAGDFPSTTSSYCLKGSFKTDNNLSQEFLSKLALL